VVKGEIVRDERGDRFGRSGGRAERRRGEEVARRRERTWFGRRERT